MFLLYYISGKSEFDELLSESLQTNPATPAHKVILIPINVFLTNDFCLHDLSELLWKGPMVAEQAGMSRFIFNLIQSLHGEDRKAEIT